MFFIYNVRECEKIFNAKIILCKKDNIIKINDSSNVLKNAIISPNIFIYNLKYKNFVIFHNGWLYIFL